MENIKQRSPEEIERLRLALAALEQTVIDDANRAPVIPTVAGDLGDSALHGPRTPATNHTSRGQEGPGVLAAPLGDAGVRLSPGSTARPQR